LVNELAESKKSIRKIQNCGTQEKSGDDSFYKDDIHKIKKTTAVKIFSEDLYDKDNECNIKDNKQDINAEAPIAKHKNENAFCCNEVFYDYNLIFRNNKLGLSNIRENTLFQRIFKSIEEENIKNKNEKLRKKNNKLKSINAELNNQKEYGKSKNFNDENADHLTESVIQLKKVLNDKRKIDSSLKINENVYSKDVPFSSISGDSEKFHKTPSICEYEKLKNYFPFNNQNYEEEWEKKKKNQMDMENKKVKEKEKKEKATEKVKEDNVVEKVKYDKVVEKARNDNVIEKVKKGKELEKRTEQNYSNGQDNEHYKRVHKNEGAHENGSNKSLKHRKILSKREKILSKKGGINRSSSKTISRSTNSSNINPNNDYCIHSCSSNYGGESCTSCINYDSAPRNVKINKEMAYERVQKDKAYRKSHKDKTTKERKSNLKRKNETFTLRNECNNIPTDNTLNSVTFNKKRETKNSVNIIKSLSNKSDNGVLHNFYNSSNNKFLFLFLKKKRKKLNLQLLVQAKYKGTKNIEKYIRIPKYTLYRNNKIIRNSMRNIYLNKVKKQRNKSSQNKFVKYSMHSSSANFKDGNISGEQVRIIRSMLKDFHTHDSNNYDEHYDNHYANNYDSNYRNNYNIKYTKGNSDNNKRNGSYYHNDDCINRDNINSNITYRNRNRNKNSSRNNQDTEKSTLYTGKGQNDFMHNNNTNVNRLAKKDDLDEKLCKKKVDKNMLKNKGNNGDEKMGNLLDELETYMNLCPTGCKGASKANGEQTGTDCKEAGKQIHDRNIFHLNNDTHTDSRDSVKFLRWDNKQKEIKEKKELMVNMLSFYNKYKHKLKFMLLEEYHYLKYMRSCINKNIYNTFKNKDMSEGNHIKDKFKMDITLINELLYQLNRSCVSHKSELHNSDDEDGSFFLFSHDCDSNNVKNKKNLIIDLYSNHIDFIDVYIQTEKRIKRIEKYLNVVETNYVEKRNNILGTNEDVPMKSKSGDFTEKQYKNDNKENSAKKEGCPFYYIDQTNLQVGGEEIGIKNMEKISEAKEVENKEHVYNMSKLINCTEKEKGITSSTSKKIRVKVKRNNNFRNSYLRENYFRNDCKPLLVVKLSKYFLCYTANMGIKHKRNSDNLLYNLKKYAAHYIPSSDKKNRYIKKYFRYFSYKKGLFLFEKNKYLYSILSGNKKRDFISKKFGNASELVNNRLSYERVHKLDQRKNIKSLKSVSDNINARINNCFLQNTEYDRDNTMEKLSHCNIEKNINHFPTMNKGYNISYINSNIIRRSASPIGERTSGDDIASFNGKERDNKSENFIANNENVNFVSSNISTNKKSYIDLLYSKMSRKNCTSGERIKKEFMKNKEANSNIPNNIDKKMEYTKNEIYDNKNDDNIMDKSLNNVNSYLSSSKLLKGNIKYENLHRNNKEGKTFENSCDLIKSLDLKNNHVVADNNIYQTNNKFRAQDRKVNNNLDILQNDANFSQPFKNEYFINSSNLAQTNKNSNSNNNDNSNDNSNDSSNDNNNYNDNNNDNSNDNNNHNYFKFSDKNTNKCDTSNSLKLLKQLDYKYASRKNKCKKGNAGFNAARNGEYNAARNGEYNAACNGEYNAACNGEYNAARNGEYNAARNGESITSLNGEDNAAQNEYFFILHENNYNTINHIDRSKNRYELNCSYEKIVNTLCNSGSRLLRSNSYNDMHTILMSKFDKSLQVDKVKEDIEIKKNASKLYMDSFNEKYQQKKNISRRYSRDIKRNRNLSITFTQLENEVRATNKDVIPHHMNNDVNETKREKFTKFVHKKFHANELTNISKDSAGKRGKYDINICNSSRRSSKNNSHNNSRSRNSSKEGRKNQSNNPGRNRTKLKKKSTNGISPFNGDKNEKSASPFNGDKNEKSASFFNGGKNEKNISYFNDVKSEGDTAKYMNIFGKDVKEYPSDKKFQVYGAQNEVKAQCIQRSKNNMVRIKEKTFRDENCSHLKINNNELTSLDLLNCNYKELYNNCVNLNFIKNENYNNNQGDQISTSDTIINEGNNNLHNNSVKKRSENNFFIEQNDKLKKCDLTPKKYINSINSLSEIKKKNDFNAITNIVNNEKKIECIMYRHTKETIPRNGIAYYNDNDDDDDNSVDSDGDSNDCFNNEKHGKLLINELVKKETDFNFLEKCSENSRTHNSDNETINKSNENLYNSFYNSNNNLSQGFHFMHENYITNEKDNFYRSPKNIINTKKLDQIIEKIRRWNKRIVNNNNYVQCMFCDKYLFKLKSYKGDEYSYDDDNYGDDSYVYDIFNTSENDNMKKEIYTCAICKHKIKVLNKYNYHNITPKNDVDIKRECFEDQLEESKERISNNKEEKIINLQSNQFDDLSYVNYSTDNLFTKSNFKEESINSNIFFKNIKNNSKNVNKCFHYKNSSDPFKNNIYGDLENCEHCDNLDNVKFLISNRKLCSFDNSSIKSFLFDFKNAYTSNYSDVSKISTMSKGSILNEKEENNQKFHNIRYPYCIKANTGTNSDNRKKNFAYFINATEFKNKSCSNENVACNSSTNFFLRTINKNFSYDINMLRVRNMNNIPFFIKKNNKNWNSYNYYKTPTLNDTINTYGTNIFYDKTNTNEQNKINIEKMGKMFFHNHPLNKETGKKQTNEYHQISTTNIRTCEHTYETNPQIKNKNDNIGDIKKLSKNNQKENVNGVIKRSNNVEKRKKRIQLEEANKKKLQETEKDKEKKIRKKNDYFTNPSINLFDYLNDEEEPNYDCEQRINMCTSIRSNLKNVKNSEESHLFARNNILQFLNNNNDIPSKNKESNEILNEKDYFMNSLRTRENICMPQYSSDTNTCFKRYFLEPNNVFTSYSENYSSSTKFMDEPACNKFKSNII
ncbi:conserved Plasmodium protein, unknown function, partial [Plasmodium malariae]